MGKLQHQCLPAISVSVGHSVYLCSFGWEAQGCHAMQFREITAEAAGHVDDKERAIRMMFIGLMWENSFPT